MLRRVRIRKWYKIFFRLSDICRRKKEEGRRKKEEGRRLKILKKCKFPVDIHPWFYTNYTSRHDITASNHINFCVNI
ncbi:hypothetical protein [Okeania sp. KiyG1]|uniref:hypothetical protein n=1 Tax=Okeania sp. KiyG1 TaxID=2720165 RepID=UPI00192486D1|nr:hypothetical protein [Okeania sp. KiyG1]